MKPRFVLQTSGPMTGCAGCVFHTTDDYLGCCGTPTSLRLGSCVARYSNGIFELTGATPAFSSHVRRLVDMHKLVYKARDDIYLTKRYLKREVR